MVSCTAGILPDPESLGLLKTSLSKRTRHGRKASFRFNPTLPIIPEGKSMEDYSDNDSLNSESPTDVFGILDFDSKAHHLNDLNTKIDHLVQYVFDPMSQGRIAHMLFDTGLKMTPPFTKEELLTRALCQSEFLGSSEFSGKMTKVLATLQQSTNSRFTCPEPDKSQKSQKGPKSSAWNDFLGDVEESGFVDHIKYPASEFEDQLYPVDDLDKSIRKGDDLDRSIHKNDDLDRSIHKNDDLDRSIHKNDDLDQTRIRGSPISSPKTNYVDFKSDHLGKSRKKVIHEDDLDESKFQIDYPSTHDYPSTRHHRSDAMTEFDISKYFSGSSSSETIDELDKPRRRVRSSSSEGSAGHRQDHSKNHNNFDFIFQWMAPVFKPARQNTHHSKINPSINGI